MSLVEQLRGAMAERADVSVAVLFGSAARGQASTRSDVDLAVRLRSPETDLGALGVHMSRAVGRAVDVVSLDDAPPLLRFEIARDGVLLVERQAHAWADFRARAMVDWWDWAPTARAMQAAAVRRLREGLVHGPS
jgi:hypothetical protein